MLQATALEETGFSRLQHLLAAAQPGGAQEHQILKGWPHPQCGTRPSSWQQATLEQQQQQAGVRTCGVARSEGLGQPENSRSNFGSEGSCLNLGLASAE